MYPFERVTDDIFRKKSYFVFLLLFFFFILNARRHRRRHDNIGTVPFSRNILRYNRPRRLLARTSRDKCRITRAAHDTKRGRHTFAPHTSSPVSRGRDFVYFFCYSFFFPPVSSFPDTRRAQYNVYCTRHAEQYITRSHRSDTWPVSLRVVCIIHMLSTCVLQQPDEPDVPDTSYWRLKYLRRCRNNGLSRGQNVIARHVVLYQPNGK